MRDLFPGGTGALQRARNAGVEPHGRRFRLRHWPFDAVIGGIGFNPHHGIQVKGCSGIAAMGRNQSPSHFTGVCAGQHRIQRAAIEGKALKATLALFPPPNDQGIGAARLIGRKADRAHLLLPPQLVGKGTGIGRFKGSARLRVQSRNLGRGFPQSGLKRRHNGPLPTCGGGRSPFAGLNGVRQFFATSEKDERHQSQQTQRHTRVLPLLRVLRNPACPFNVRGSGSRRSRQKIIGINPASKIALVRRLINIGIANIQPLARSLQRLGQQRANILFKDLLRGFAMPLGLRNSTINRGIRANATLEFIGPSPSNQQAAPGAILTIGKAKRALFAQGIPAIACENMEQIMRVAQAIAIPLYLILKDRASHAHFFGFSNQPSRRQAFASHERHIGMSNRIFRQLQKRLMIIQHIGQIGLALHQRPAFCAFTKGFRIRPKGAARQAFKNAEYLFGILLVADQLTKMRHCLERTKAQSFPARIGEVRRCHKR